MLGLGVSVASSRKRFLGTVGKPLVFQTTSGDSPSEINVHKAAVSFETYAHDAATHRLQPD